MELEKAIEILSEEIKHPYSVKKISRPDAMKLGIEALNFRLHWEQQEGEDDFLLLPWETKE